MNAHALECRDLSGDCLVRIAYLDEAGISNRDHEPVIAVSAVIVDADKQLLAVQRYLTEMANALVPPEKREGFVFHATELFSGGKTFDRYNWPLERRLPILQTICEIPRLFGLKLVPVAINRADWESKNQGVSHADQTIRAQVAGAMVCIIGVERYMREKTPEDEVALIVHEDNNNSRKLMREVVNYAKTPNSENSFSVANQKWHGLFPLQRVVDTVHFAAKAESGVLQVVDAVAFVTKRKAAGLSHMDRFFEPLLSQFVMRSNGLSQPKAWKVQ